MVGTISTERPTTALEFGMYRDGDNNLDEIQSLTIAQALQTSKRDASIQFTVEDTTSRRGLEPANVLRTESYEIESGHLSKHVDVSSPHDMSARGDLAKFVAHVLDNAETTHAKQTWLDLIDHGGGDGGGLESTHSKTGLMREDDISGAIADGVAMHAKAHPEDAGRGVDGVVANQWQTSVLNTGSTESRGRMLQSMDAFESNVSDSGLLLAIKASDDSLSVFEDGRGVLFFRGRSMDLSREIGRYTLRRIYLGVWGAASEGEGAIEKLASELELCRFCHRRDCGAPIADDRRLAAFDRDTPAKWCSVRCQRTEATRRYRSRHAQ